MKTILTLVSNPATAALSLEIVRTVRVALEQANAVTSPPDWLAPQIACDITLRNIENEQAEEIARDVLVNAPIDLLAQGREHRRKALLVADMDSTMITVECLDELADYAGKKAEVSAITERAMAGELDFEGALKERVHMLAGMDAAMLERVWEERIHLMPGAKELVATMAAHKACAILVSGGFTYFTSRVAEALGMAEHRGNELIISGGTLTGEVGMPILGRSTKAATLEGARKRLALTRPQTLAVGDGANDLDMLKGAGLGVAYHAKPVVAKAARAQVNHGDLTALLYFQGYRQSEFN